MGKFIRFILDSAYRFKILDARGFFKKWSDKNFLKAAYYSKYHKKLDLENPQSYNEKLQWLKLYYRKPIMTKMVDKYEVKEYVADMIGEEYIIPTLGVWDKFEDIDFDTLPNQFVLKCTHDSGGIFICKDKSKIDKIAIGEKINNSLKRNYYNSSREWPYKDVKPRIIAEQYMESIAKCDNENKFSADKTDVETLQSKHGLLDYKFMCFNGEVKALFLDIGVMGENTSGHSHSYYRSIYDKQWNVMPFKETREHYPIDIVKPDFYEEMIDVAEKLSAGFPHLRVDLYYINGHIYVGELTFFHGSGMTNDFSPKEWDYTFGSWIKLPEVKD